MNKEKLSLRKILFFGLLIIYIIFILLCLIIISGSDISNSYLVGFFLMVVLSPFIVFAILGWKLFRKKEDRSMEKFRLIGEKNET